MEGRRPRRPKQLSPPFPPLPPVGIFTEGNRSNGELKTWRDGAPAVPNNSPLPFLPYLLSEFLQKGTEVTVNSKHGGTAPPPSQTTLPPFPPLPTVGIFTEGNRGNGERKTWRDGAPAVPNKPLPPSLPSLLSKFLQKGTEVTVNSKHGGTAPPPSQTTLPSLPSLTSCQNFYRRERR